MFKKLSLQVFIFFMLAFMVSVATAGATKQIDHLPFCGPEMLEYIYKHYSIPYSLEHIKDYASKHYGLTSFADLAEDARGHKLKTFAFKNGDVDFIKKVIKEGLIVFNNNGHFALIEKIEGDSVYIYNPRFGFENYSMHRRIFESHWDGTGLVISNKKIRAAKAVKKGKLGKICYMSERERQESRGANPCSNCGGLGGPGFVYSVGNGALYNKKNISASTSDPVNLQNGNMFMNITDMNIPARGQDLTLTRFYNAQTVSEVDGFIPDEGAGSWVIENGEYSGQGDRSFTKSTFDNFTLELDLKTVTPGATYPWEMAWVNFRFFDKNNRYYVLIKSDGVMELARRKNLSDPAPPAILATVPSGVNPLNFNRLKIEANSNNIKVYVNGVLRININDSNPIIGSGYIALESYFCHAHYDNITITAPGNNQFYSFSHDDNDFIFGWGWSHSYSMRIKEYSDHVTLIHDNNSRQVFTSTGNGAYTSVPFTTYTALTKDAAGFTLRFKHGDIRRFDLSGKLLYTEDRSGNRTTLGYTLIGGKQRLTSIASDGTRALTLQYGPNNQVSSVTDPLGHQTKYIYNAQNHLIRVEDREEHSRQYTYNPINHNMTESKDREDNTYVYTYAYNDRMLSQRDPLGNYTHFDYNWDTTHVVNDKGEMYKYNFDSKLFLQAVEDPYAKVEYTLNDDNGNITRYTDKNSRETNFVYVNGNVTDILDAQLHHTRFTYDPVYNMPLTSTDTRGFTTTYEYESGNLTKTIAPSPLNYETNMTYNSLGEMTSMTDPRDNTTTCEYNSDGDLTQITQPENRVTNFDYDANGRLVKMTDALEQETTFTYDEEDRRTSVTDPLERTTNFTYSPNGNLLSVTDHEQNTTTYSYDVFGNLLNTIDGQGGVSSTSFDNDNYMHLAVSNPVTVTNPNWHPPTVMVYDALNRLKTETDAQSKQYTFTYDNQGNLTRRVDAKTQQTDYVYNQLNKLIDINYAIGNDVHYERDEAGNIKWIDDIQGRTFMFYDELNRLVKVRYPGLADMDYTYDGAGNLTRVIYPSGRNVEYVYNENNEMVSVIENNITLANYAYDKLGRRIKKEVMAANTLRSSYSYDSAGQLIKMGNKLSRSSLQADLGTLYYVYDGAGNRTMAGGGPNGPISYSYDDIYQLISSSGAQTHNYTYDPTGNRIYSDGVSYITNNLNQYTQVGGINYTYDSNGNMKTRGVTNYGYDFENRLSSVSGGIPLGGRVNATYLYDGLGRRIRKTVNSAVTKFVYDGDRVIEERNSSGGLIAEYVYGAGLDEVLVMTRATGERYYYIYDGLGSVIQLTNAQGQVVESYSYDPYGKPLNVSYLGNPYMFTGALYDREIGLYYMRARMYDPTIGRFLQRDPLGYIDSVNLYTYVVNNPINLIDPMGEAIPLIVWSFLGGAVGGIGFDAGIQVIGNFIGGQALFSNIDGRSMATSGAFGALAGGAGFGFFTQAGRGIKALGNANKAAGNFWSRKIAMLSGKIRNENKTAIQLLKLNQAMQEFLDSLVKGATFPLFKDIYKDLFFQDPNNVNANK
ncbi:MAG: DUF1080 domain-containing protein [Candidatus Omnitrophica bacterium]|nr:DUF1080 domain-containing protein [Candidatus Omnitrophota bacterium]